MKFVKYLMVIICPLMLAFISACIPTVQPSSIEKASPSDLPISSPSSSPLIQPPATDDGIEISTDIGAYFDPSRVVHIYNISFAPKVSKSEVIAKARDILRTGPKIDADQLPALATVAHYSGFNLSGVFLYDVPVWIVVITDVPVAPFRTLNPSPPGLDNVDRVQLSAVFDAMTGSLIYVGIDSKK